MGHLGCPTQLRIFYVTIATPPGNLQFNSINGAISTTLWWNTCEVKELWPISCWTNVFETRPSTPILFVLKQIETEAMPPPSSSHPPKKCLFFFKANLKKPKSLETHLWGNSSPPVPPGAEKKSSEVAKTQGFWTSKAIKSPSGVTVTPIATAWSWPTRWGRVSRVSLGRGITEGGLCWKGWEDDEETFCI